MIKRKDLIRNLSKILTFELNKKLKKFFEKLRYGEK